MTPTTLDVEQMLLSGSMTGPYRRFQPLTPRRRLVRMLRALVRDLRLNRNSK